VKLDKRVEVRECVVEGYPDSTVHTSEARKLEAQLYVRGRWVWEGRVWIRPLLVIGGQMGVVFSLNELNLWLGFPCQFGLDVHVYLPLMVEV
jgi:hypothetical protein